MKVVKLVLAEVANPETGAVTTRARGILDNGRDISIINSPDELKNFGDKTKVLGSLRLVPGEYGDFLALPRYKVLQDDFSWEVAEEEN